MKTELQNAWMDYCESNEDRVDQDSFVAGWAACDRYAGHSIDELAFIGRQMARGVAREDLEAELSPPRSHPCPPKAAPVQMAA
jgi:hypothetical protein